MKLFERCDAVVRRVDVLQIELLHGRMVTNRMHQLLQDHELAEGHLPDQEGLDCFVFAQHRL